MGSRVQGLREGPFKDLGFGVQGLGKASFKGSGKAGLGFGCYGLGKGMFERIGSGDMAVHHWQSAALRCYNRLQNPNSYSNLPQASNSEMSRRVSAFTGFGDISS